MLGISLSNYTGHKCVPQEAKFLNFSGCHAMRLHYVCSGIWDGVERKCLKFKSEKWKLSLSAPFSAGAQTCYVSGAVVASEANLPLGSCDRQKCSIPYQAAQDTWSFNIIQKHLLFLFDKLSYIPWNVF